MIKIEAVVRSTKFHEVQHALHEAGVPTFSAYDIKLTGLHKGHTTGGRPGTFRSSDLIAKTNITVICSENEESKIIQAITESARTGDKGDGLISVYPIHSLIKIRDGKTGEAAVK